ncbi:Gfo/Idh/MocA family oxidoreductase [Taibaiella lutea]|uniref:Gfo/Idh/MocA family oxidoreductase n=1 Tax=Taibaiella lutea TaxID=2608001 RepID=A0A5M6CNE3_9BACT|nr:Gfo/Idh/MocA family oxidoreductase [Taibaiella lutea]KAA5536738.1 Gfo/Idh/MocA family oxidoreductase [Taibaiella lutea]
MIHFAIIGFGHIGKRHAEHILNNDACKLVAVCDIDADGAKHLPDAGISFYNDYAEMLSGTNIDVVCICTPNYLHCQHAVEAMKAGKHVVVEKPMAMSIAECDEMIAVAKSTKQHVFAVKQNRYNPPVAAVKDLVQSGRMGKVYMMQVNCFWNRSNNYYAQSEWRGKKDKDGGCLFTQFSHFIDILYYLNGNISKASGVLRNFAHQDNTEFEDSGAFVLEAENGSLINFNFSTCAYEKNMEGSITILAENGTLKIGGQYLNTLEYQCIQGEALPQINIVAKENDYGLYKGSMSNHDKVIQNVVDVLNHDMPIMTGAEEGKAVVGIIEMMYANVHKT